MPAPSTRRSRSIAARTVAMLFGALFLTVFFGGVASAADVPDDWAVDPATFDSAEVATPSESTGPAIDPSSPCNGRAILFSDGRLYDAKQVNYVEVEGEDAVAWQGWLDGAAPGQTAEPPRQVSGTVTLKVAGIDVDLGSWDSETTKLGDSGVRTWNLPSGDLAAGVELPVSGTHTEEGISCSGSGTLVIAGTSPLAWVAGGLALFSFVGVVISIIPKGA